MTTATRKRAGRDLAEVIDELPLLMSRRDVLALLRVSRTTLDDWIRAGHFPRPIQLSQSSGHQAKAGRWTKASLRRWLEQQARR
jgi:predicted DNA-binding transcriptional regulator AlpA